MTGSFEQPEDRARIAERYVVEDTLGEGTMGTIYRVFDGASETSLALKQLKVESSDTTGIRIALFQREYHTLKQLAHPRIIRVYDYGVADGVPYYTMELLDGQDIRELAPLEPERACALLRDVASSLAIVHSRGLVYRDISPHNVRCTSDGRAKLLDFGALAQMGLTRQIVGTAGFVPPEAIYGQPLDQRADLYSLGVLAYWLLTGHRPFRVRDLRELQDAWRTRPPQPSAVASAVPEALDALVMSLLSLNPTGRPQHAAEVIDKLTALGQLPPDHDLGATRAYLTTPELVAREEEVLRIRKALVRATRGRGSGLLVRGPPGAGRSRLIDASVLEAKLMGALVARADASAISNQDFAAVRSVVEQWGNALPEPVASELRAAVCKSRAQSRGTRATHDDGVHLRISAAILDVARKRALMLAVDDAHRIDTASVAVFALLAQASDGTKILLCGSLPADVDVRQSIPLRMLIEATRPIELTPWTLPETESLMRSVFGAVPNVPLAADRIHRVALGNPGDTMQLAQHLVDAGITRHQAGAWSLPTTMDEVALPGNMAQAQQCMIDALDGESRTLAATLALIPDFGQLALTDYARLSPDALSRLDALSRKGVLVQRGEAFAFRHRGLATALVDAMDREQRSALHLRLVAMYQAGEHHALTIAYHLHHAGRVDECLQAVRPWVDNEVNERFLPHQIELLETIVCDGDRYPLGARERHRLRAVLVQYAAVGDPDYGRHGEASFERLRKDTGLEYWDEHRGLEPAARIGRCLERAQAVYEGTPEEQRGFAPFDAVRELAVLVRSMTSVYARTLAADKLIDLAGWLEPFRLLSPVVQLLYELTSTSADRAVREKRVAHRYLDFASRFEQPLPGVDKVVRQSAIAICTYCAAMDEAKQAKASVLARVESIEQVDTFAALAWHVRMLCHIYSGRTEEAAQCRQRMELLVIQEDRPNTLLAMSVLYEAWGYEMCEDLTGLKGALERVEVEAARYAGWQPWATLYRGDMNRLRGDLAAAFSDYEQAAAITAPGRHQVWPHLTERRVVALRQLGRVAESVALGKMIVKFAEDEDLEPVNRLRAYVALALSEAQAGLCEDAARNIESALGCAEREGIGGVPLGIVHEAAARLAIRNGDAAAFERASSECARFLLAGGNAALTAKYDRLLQEARAAGLSQVRAHHAAEGTAPQVLAVLSLLQEAQDDAARANIALDVLAAHYRAGAGCLFGVTPQGPELLARVGTLVSDEQLRAMVAEYLSAELTDTEIVTLTQADARAARGSANIWTLGDNAAYIPVLLHGRRGAEQLLCAVAVLRLETPPSSSPEPRLLQALGQVLLDGNKISGMPIAN